MKARYPMIGLVGLLVLLGGCAGQSPRPPAMTSTAPVTQPAPEATSAQVATPLPATGVAAMATMEPATRSADLSITRREVFNIGLPAGDAYSPMSVAIDDEHSIAYVYHGDSAEQRPVISVVDLAAGQVTRLIRLAETTPSGGGRLLMAPDRKQLYLISFQTWTLTPVNVETGALGPSVPGIHDGALSQDGRILYALGEVGLRAHVLADLLGGQDRPLWQVDDVRFGRLALGGERLLASVFDPERALVSFDVRAGEEVARVALPDYLGGLAAGPDGGWAATVTGQKALLIRYDAALKAIAETPIPYAYELTYDSLRQQYLVAGYMPGQGGDERPVILGFSAGDLKRTASQDWLDQEAPTAFLPWGRDTLVGFTPAGAARLALFDAASLAPRGRIITGVRATNVALDDGSGTLYVADDQERIHVLRLPEGREVGLWEGGAPLVLDGANRRLYANSSTGVRALDMGTGEVVASFPQEGYAAPDPNRDVVYIAQSGVTLYDRNGSQLGRLDSTFPVEGGFVPNAYAYAAIVNPVTGNVGVILNNGIPGSNNGSFLRVYSPKSDHPIDVGGPHSFVMDVLTDRDGNWYVSYSPVRGQEAVQVLSPSGKELRRLDGRTGEMVLDEANGRLHLLLEGTITVLEASSLTPLGFSTGPEHMGSLGFSPSRRTLYVTAGDDPRVESLSIDRLSSIDLRPQPGSPGQEIMSEGLAVVSDGRTSQVLAQFGGLYRTRAGAGWERLPVGVQSIFGRVTTAPPNVVFFVGQGSLGADGVWRSLDAGDTWELLAAGLTDLRPAGPVLARGPNEAYFQNRSQGLLRWDPAGRRWLGVEGKLVDGVWGALALAPDGVLFRAGTDLLARSADQGASWETLKPPGKSGEIIGFTPMYTVTHTLFGMWGDLDRELLRSRDAGKSWERVTGMIDFSPDTYTPQIVSGFGEMVMLVRRYSNLPILLRSTDLGETWLVAPAEIAAGAENLAVDPLDGWLWLGVRGGVRSVVPDDVQWLPASSIAPTVTTTPVPTGTSVPASRATRGPLPESRGLQPTATVGPCEQPLTGADAEVNARGLGLGCPREAATTVPAARQRFQNGQMIWRGDQKRIYVLYGDGRWEGYPDKWIEGDPADDPTLTPPNGLQQPVRGFGRVWRKSLGGPKAAIGWALEKEQGQPAQVQNWDYGIVLRFGGEVIVLQDRGAWR